MEKIYCRSDVEISEHGKLYRLRVDQARKAIFGATLKPYSFAQGVFSH
jgi:hypothetical protein